MVQLSVIDINYTIKKAEFLDNVRVYMDGKNVQSYSHNATHRFNIFSTVKLISSYQSSG